MQNGDKIGDRDADEDDPNAEVVIDRGGTEGAVPSKDAKEAARRAAQERKRKAQRRGQSETSYRKKNRRGGTSEADGGKNLTRSQRSMEQS
jgi:hypothetical protein